MDIVDPKSYNYRRLKQKYPNETIFYSSYYDGDYYNKARTTYYDSNKKELESETHSRYG